METLIKNKQEETTTVPNQALLELAEVSILLDSYDDIFSDFDPSLYSERALSDDFIEQVKKITGSKKGNKMILRFLLPANMRNEQQEKIIVKRLHSYFKSAHQQLESEVKGINKSGLVLIFIGIFMMLAASYISFMQHEKYLVHFLLVLFEPAGWFFLWAGLDRLVFSSKGTKKELDFYLRITKSEIKFFTY